MINAEADLVTIERAAEHLNIPVARASDLAGRHTSIRRVRRKGSMVYSLTMLVRMHLKEAIEQQSILPVSGLPAVTIVLGNDFRASDEDASSRMRWIDDGGSE